MLMSCQKETTSKRTADLNQDSGAIESIALLNVVASIVLLLPVVWDLSCFSRSMGGSLSHLIQPIRSGPNK
jgi:hypothetical protein